MSLFEMQAVSPDTLNQKFEGQEKSPEEKVAELQDPRLNTTYTFNFSYIDERGREWKGEFVNRILNVMQIPRVASIRAAMLGNTPLDAIDLPTFQHAERLAHLTVSLIGRPKWAEKDKLENLYDPQIITLLYEEVVSHETIFHGREPNPPAGDGRAANEYRTAKSVVQNESPEKRKTDE